MSGTALNELPPGRQADILAALAAVETAEQPVRPTGFRGLLDPALRAGLEGCLAAQGRVLLKVGDGYLSGYRDDLGRRLAADGIGVLPPDDRAVLALVLLHCVAIPRAAGRLRGDSWLDAEPITPKELGRSQVSDTKVRGALQRLRNAGLLRYGARRSILPGPQFARLTPQVSAELWENLVLVAQPDGVMGEVIRRRRSARRQHAEGQQA